MDARVADAPVETDALVIGSGIAGLQTALDLADRGFKVLVAERENADYFEAVLGKLKDVPWAGLETTEQDCRRMFLGHAHRVGFDMELSFTEETLLRAVVKYGRAVAHTKRRGP